MTDMYLRTFGLLLITAVIDVRGASSASRTTCVASCFCNKPRTYISCAGNDANKIPADVPRTAVYLEIHGYKTSTFTKNAIVNLRDLMELKLQRNDIVRIENGTFATLKKLRKLELNDNKIRRITRRLFVGLDGLQYLDLSRNSLTDLSGSFVELKNLKNLKLQNNAISKLSGDSFSGLNNLQYVDVSDNNIASVSIGTFQHLTQLGQLIIANNPLRSLDKLNFFGNKLRYVDVSETGLTAIPESLTKFVRDFRLSNNEITRISKSDFENFPFLVLLVLDDNGIETIEDDSLGRQQYLIYLWLIGNKLTEVPRTLPESLYSLYLERNAIRKLDNDSFKGLRKLEKLTLRRNLISTMAECTFCELRNLIDLNLQSNLLATIPPKIFPQTNGLEYLDLSDNNIESIDGDTFKSLASLKVLKLSQLRGEIKMADSAFDGLNKLQTLIVFKSPRLVNKLVESRSLRSAIPNLASLNIMQNGLTKLPSDFPTYFPKLKRIYLTGNKWRCDDSITWLTRWIKLAKIYFDNAYEIRCTSPKHLASKRIVSLRFDDDVPITTYRTPQPYGDTTPTSSADDVPITTSRTPQPYGDTMPMSSAESPTRGTVTVATTGDKVTRPSVQRIRINSTAGTKTRITIASSENLTNRRRSNATLSKSGFNFEQINAKLELISLMVIVVSSILASLVIVVMIILCKLCAITNKIKRKGEKDGRQSDISGSINNKLYYAFEH